MKEIVPMPPTRPASDPVEEYIAWMLVAIEANYRREGTNWGSRFEGERLEVVQARAVIRHIRNHPSFDRECACSIVLADRERELLELKGPCSSTGCRLHYAHSGPCDKRAVSS